jgi:hypothetical protein
MKICAIIIFLTIFLFIQSYSYTKAFRKRLSSRHFLGTTICLDIYESYASCNANFRLIRPVEKMSELQLYLTLLKRSLDPKYILVQVTGNPMINFSSWFERKHSIHYEKFKIAENFNVLEVLSAGYQEPYSMSLFLGDLMPFWEKTKEGRKQAGSAVSGFVATFSNRSIVRNILVENNWIDLQWKIKVVKATRQTSISSVFSGGMIFYGSPLFSNALVLDLCRERYSRSKWNFRDNSSIRLLLKMPIFDRNNRYFKDYFSENMIDLGVSYPIRKFKTLSFSLNLGYIWTHIYNEQGIREQDLQFFIRPNVLF